jgi:hypothetical protein
MLALLPAHVQVTLGTCHLVHMTNNLYGRQRLPCVAATKWLLLVSSCSDWCLWCTWCHLSIPPVHACVLQEIFKYIGRYNPGPLEQLPARLMPFIPEYIPAIGSTDEFIKVPRPDGQPDYLGLKVRWQLHCKTAQLLLQAGSTLARDHTVQSVRGRMSWAVVGHHVRHAVPQIPCFRPI